MGVLAPIEAIATETGHILSQVHEPHFINRPNFQWPLFIYL